MSITTKVGDKGTTRLLNGDTVWKDDPCVDAYGDTDELVCILGIARHHVELAGTKDLLQTLQRDLFTVGAELSARNHAEGMLSFRITKTEVEKLMEVRDKLEAEIAMPKDFVLPAGTLAAAHIDHARAVTRRAERKIARLLREEIISNAQLLIWMNRLSDLLWLLARREEGEFTKLNSR